MKIYIFDNAVHTHDDIFARVILTASRFTKLRDKSKHLQQKLSQLKIYKQILSDKNYHKKSLQSRFLRKKVPTLILSQLQYMRLDIHSHDMDSFQFVDQEDYDAIFAQNEEKNVITITKHYKGYLTKVNIRMYIQYIL